MKTLLLTFFLVGLFIQPKTIKDTMATSKFYDFKMHGIDGTAIDFSAFKGKKVLLINVASKCGYTPQYKDLQALHEQFGDKVTLLGFPANNFGRQEPGANAEIADFCKKNYGVSFQMFEKISVKGADQHPLYQWLSAESGKEPGWNFCKYLVSEDGTVEQFYSSGTNPMGNEILTAIGAK